MNSILEDGVKTQDFAEQVWLHVMAELKNYYGEATYNNWLAKLSFVSKANGHLTLRAPSKFIKDWVVNNYIDSLKKVWEEADSNLVAVDILVESKKSSVLINDYALSEQENKLLESKEESYGLFKISSGLDPRFTFENFVVGAPNELAYAAAKSVAEAEYVQSECNPLFLYGGVGLGKTHLMHAIAWHITNNNKRRNVVYMSAEQFMYQFIRALKEKKIMPFKERFRSVDVLMIDDVQFICGKDSTQEEFFHTFNTLMDNGCQIVISGDRSPRDLDGMEDRVKSRLGWGLVVDVHSTNYELRLGILHSKIEQIGIEVPEKVLAFLASKITSNVRELEGALNKVIAHSKLTNAVISLETTQDILRDLLRSSEKIVTIEEIQKKVAERFNVRVSDMSSSRRMRSIARPRQIAMYLSKMLTPRSLAEIGKKFGGKDHTTVMHAVRKVEELTETDKEFADEVKLLTRILQD